MIGGLLDRAARRAEQADAIAKTDETLTAVFESGRLKSISLAQEQGANLRVMARGRMGFAGTTAPHWDDLIEQALESARVGPEIPLEMPSPRPLPTVSTHAPAAAAADARRLTEIGELVVSRLVRDGCQVNVSVERSLGSVRVGNSHGVDAGYDVTSVSVSAELTRVADDDVLIIAEHLAGADLPTTRELELLTGRMLERLEWSRRSATAPTGTPPVCFTPAGTDVLLAPFRQACLGRSAHQGVSPLAGREGEAMFDPRFSLVDDALLDWRAGSRPVDDECVPSRRTLLVDAGRVGGFVWDLETAGLAGVSATGHGRRSIFGKPRTAYSNLMVLPGEDTPGELLARMETGLLVDDLIGVGQGNVVGGAFSRPVALAFRVEGGEVTGRVKRATVAGTAYDLLRNLAGIGNELQWMGSVAAPHLLVEGVKVEGGER